MKRNAADVLTQLTRAGVLHHIQAGTVTVHEHSIKGLMDLAALDEFTAHPEFRNGPFHRLHKTDGDLKDQTEFRSYRGAFGAGSLQVVINRKTGSFEADVDVFNPYEDLVGVVGHLFGEVVPNTVRGWFSRKQDA